MPELPDISAYISALEPRILNQPLERVRITSPFLLRTADPPLDSVNGRTVRAIRRIGKRIAIGLSDELWLEQMIRWQAQAPVGLGGQREMPRVASAR